MASTAAEGERECVKGDLRASSLDLDLSTLVKSEERRDLKMGLALSVGSFGLCARWWFATKFNGRSGEERAGDVDVASEKR